MRIIKIIKLAPIIILSFVRCGESVNNTIANDIKKLQSKHIELCLDSMIFCQNVDHAYLKEDSLSYYDNVPGIVVYFEPNRCSVCEMKSLYRWFDTIDEIKELYGYNVRFYFIFSTEKDIEELRNALTSISFYYPVFIDRNKVFERVNGHLPQNNILHTFLVDGDRNVLLVGSPFGNEKLKSMYCAELDKLINN